MCKPKLWVFGDSFCSYKSNWIKTIQEKSNLDIRMLGVPGSSIYYTYMKLQNHIPVIDKTDSVIVGITSPLRHYLKGHHFLVSDPSFCKVATYDNIKDIHTFKEGDSSLQEAYKNFIFNLYDENYEITINKVLTESIKNLKLNCKNFIVFKTLNGIEFEEDKNCMSYTYFSFIKKYIDKNITYIDSTKYMNGLNHWIDHPDFESYFWERHEKTFNKLWL